MNPPRTGYRQDSPIREWLAAPGRSILLVSDWWLFKERRDG